MSTNKLFIPTKLAVGFNYRKDCYTNKLAYVTYYDQKGVLRKEKSWDDWSEVETEQYNQDLVNGKWTTRSGYPREFFDNVPTEGFVLNKNAGGYSTGWNHRQTYCRIFDPRGFEFELTIPNLLFILQECNSSKGKGLEGEFVYAWDGKELVLLPCSSVDYKESTDFTKMQSNKITKKMLVPGCSYKTKRMEDLIYLGQYDWYQWVGVDEGFYKMIYKPSKLLIFLNEAGEYETLTSPNKLAIQNTDIPVSNYAELIDNLGKHRQSNAIVGWKFEDWKKDDLQNVLQIESYRDFKYLGNFFFPISDTSAQQFNIRTFKKQDGSVEQYFTVEKYSNVLHFEENTRYSVNNYSYHYDYTESRNKKYTEDEIKELGLIRIKAVYADGVEEEFKGH